MWKQKVVYIPESDKNKRSSVLHWMKKNSVPGIFTFSPCIFYHRCVFEYRLPSVFWMTNGQAMRWANQSVGGGHRLQHGVWWVAGSLTGSQATEQSLLHTGLSELAWGCWLCNKAFNGHTASPCLPGANTKSLFTVARPDVGELSISHITPEASVSVSGLKHA